MQKAAEDRGQDLFKTSTHTGHHYRPSTYFPSSNYERVLGNPIPKTLNSKDQVLPEVRFQTTTGEAHDTKHVNDTTYNDPLSMRNTKALPCYKVNYMNDLVERLNSKPRRPLTMGFQKSEMKQEYEETGGELAYEYDRPIRPNTYLIDDEHYETDTQVLYDGNYKTSVPPPKPIDPSQVGVLNLLDPYMTTYNKQHKQWTRDQLKNEAKQDAVTIYNDENLKKADYLNKNQNMSVDMKDDIWFKTEAKSRHVHRPPKAVPHTGAISETQQMFTMPSDVKAKQTKVCPIDTPFTQPPTSTKSVYGTHDMYKSEASNIGRGNIGYVPNNSLKSQQ